MVTLSMPCLRRHTNRNEQGQLMAPQKVNGCLLVLNMYVDSPGMCSGLVL